MAHVVLLRGVNVGGHRRFRPAALARDLRHLGVVNIGAAGTFVVRAPARPARLRAEIARRLPFDADIVVFPGREIVRLLSGDWFAGHPARPDIVHFVSVLTRRARSAPQTPVSLPPRGRWLVKILACDGRFVIGVYRREMRVLRHLDALDQLFGVPLTTRSWSTILAIAKALDGVPRARSVRAGRRCRIGNGAHCPSGGRPGTAR